MVKIGLLPESQAPATQRSLSSQSWTVRCVRGYSIRHGSTIVALCLTAGCMAERLKTQLLETDKMVDLVAGPGKESVVMCR